jgi:hypothetical protein
MKKPVVKANEKDKGNYRWIVSLDDKLYASDSESNLKMFLKQIKKICGIWYKDQLLNVEHSYMPVYSKKRTYVKKNEQWERQI